MRRLRNLLAVCASIGAAAGVSAQTTDASMATAAWLTERMAEGGVEGARVFKFDCDPSMGLCLYVLARLKPSEITRAGECDSPFYAQAGLRCSWIVYKDGLVAQISWFDAGAASDVSYVELTRPQPTAKP
jgi:hypothetical protein